MCMFPNGLRVIRDISPELLQQIRNCGYPLLLRRFERHDGEGSILAHENARYHDDKELQAIGICRWKLQKVLHDAVIEQGMNVQFKKKTYSVEHMDDFMRIDFSDGTHCCARILFGVDGSRSVIRKAVVGKGHELKYTGVTCIMGLANDLPMERGISFPSSYTTKCHASFFPTQENEQCFQIFLPIPIPIAIPSKRNEGDWHIMSGEMSKYECERLAKRLKRDGWHEKYLAPLMHVQRAVRVKFCNLRPHLKKIVYATRNESSFTILVGDAAHPPDIYTGQGAQLGIEDAGVIALLIKQIYPNIASENSSETFQPKKFQDAMCLYERMRAPRTKAIIEEAHEMGAMQQKRATNSRYNLMKEESLAQEVSSNENLPIYDHAVNYDYNVEVQNAVQHINTPRAA